LIQFKGQAGKCQSIDAQMQCGRSGLRSAVAPVTKVKAIRPAGAQESCIATGRLAADGNGSSLIFIKESAPAIGQTVAMQRIAQTLSSLILGLALVLAGPGGVHPANAAMKVVLCAGDEPSTIWLDGNGNPVDPDAKAHKCSDFVAFDAQLPAATALLAGMLLPRIPAVLALPGAPRSNPSPCFRPDPRGPPATPVDLRPDGDSRHVTRFPRSMAPQILDTYQAAAVALVTRPPATV
jgi:hypothetical protein